jgi:hypothetical protein
MRATTRGAEGLGDVVVGALPDRPRGHPRRRGGGLITAASLRRRSWRSRSPLSGRGGVSNTTVRSLGVQRASAVGRPADQTAVCRSGRASAPRPARRHRQRAASSPGPDPGPPPLLRDTTGGRPAVCARCPTRTAVTSVARNRWSSPCPDQPIVMPWLSKDRLVVAVGAPVEAVPVEDGGVPAAAVADPALSIRRWRSGGLLSPESQVRGASGRADSLRG